VADIVAREARGAKREMLEVGPFYARAGSLRRARGGRASGGDLGSRRWRAGWGGGGEGGGGAGLWRREGSKQ
jgi:hypothetical protein